MSHFQNRVTIAIYNTLLHFYTSKSHFYKELTLKLDYSVSMVNSNFNIVLKLSTDDQQRKLSGKLF